MPAAAVTPAPIVYMKVAAVKKLIVELKDLVEVLFTLQRPCILGGFFLEKRPSRVLFFIEDSLGILLVIDLSRGYMLT